MGFTQYLAKRSGGHFFALRLLAAGSQIVFCLVPILFRTAIHSAVKLVELVSAGLHGRVRKSDTRIIVDLSGKGGFRANVDFGINHINLLEVSRLRGSELQMADLVSEDLNEERR